MAGLAEGDKHAIASSVGRRGKNLDRRRLAASQGEVRGSFAPEFSFKEAKTGLSRTRKSAQLPTAPLQRLAILQRGMRERGKE